MATIAGRENEPAGTVFKNVQLMKNVPAGQFLTAMDKGIGAGVGRGCTECHLETDWASDTLPRKRTTRFMMEMVAGINSQWLSRRPGRGGTPPTISCVTCHRGGGGAVAQNTQIIP
jgi:photosynthetic reaction center cytochrome c subunit